MCRRSSVMSHSATDRPSTSTRPADAVSSPLISLRVVVFPEPLGPSSMRSSPFAMARLRSARSMRFPLVRYSTCPNSIACIDSAFIAGVPSHPPAGDPQPVHGCGFRPHVILLVQPSRQLQGWRPRHSSGKLRAICVTQAPLSDVVEIKNDAERIGGNKSPLAGLQPDY